MIPPGPLLRMYQGQVGPGALRIGPQDQRSSKFFKNFRGGEFLGVIPPGPLLRMYRCPVGPGALRIGSQGHRSSKIFKNFRGGEFLGTIPPGPLLRMYQGQVGLGALRIGPQDQRSSKISGPRIFRGESTWTLAAHVPGPSWAWSVAHRLPRPALFKNFQQNFGAENF